MKHSSVMVETPCEVINITPVNPLISKCQIKVCYVSEQPNRNGSIITKEVAKQMANSLPGSPIVGFFNEETGDFEEHNSVLEISEKEGVFKFKDVTKPYGFVDMNAKCWFQEFVDDGKDKREYLMTEGWLWTGQYPECKRVLERGNNQSMELDGDLIDASWTKNKNGEPEFFIINEAIISKLCILGEDFEPCFEGASISKVNFSFEPKFKDQLFSMMQELTDLLKEQEGGSQVFTTYAVKVGDSLWNTLYSFAKEKEYTSIEAVLVDGERKFAVIKDKDENVYSLDFSVAEDGTIELAKEVVVMNEYTPSEEPQFALEDIEAFEAQFKKEEDEKNEDKDDKSEDSKSENIAEGENSSEDKKSPEKEDEEDQKKKYSLEDEYKELYSKLKTDYAKLLTEKEELDNEVKSLRQFRLEAERKEKENMINQQFFMLSDEDTAEVRAKIDEYSLSDIEKELSVICVRNKVSFTSLEEEDKKDPTTYNLTNLDSNEGVPAWVKAVLDTAKTLN